MKEQELQKQEFNCIEEQLIKEIKQLVIGNFFSSLFPPYLE